MIIVDVLALFFVNSAAAGAGDPPSGAPTGPFVTFFDSPEKWKVHWVNGDATAYTRVHRAALGDSFGSSTFIGSVNPGQTSLNTDDLTEGAHLNPAPLPGDGDYTYHIFHRKNGQDSAVVSVDTDSI